MARPFKIFAGLVLAVAVPAAAHTFGFSPGSAAPACFAIGDTSYRLTRDAADVTMRIDPAAAAPGLRIKLAQSAEDADFVFVDDGAPPVCKAGSNVRAVSIGSGTGAADMVLAFASGSAPADYSIYVRSRWIAPETAAALFAAAHLPPQRIAGRRTDRSN